MKTPKMLLYLMMVVLYQTFAFASDPIASYSFDVDASDATGNYNGTLEGDAAIVDDAERGKVVEFVADGYVDIPAFIADEMEDFSFSTWVNYDGTVQWAGLVGMGLETSGGFPYWDFHMRADNILSFYSSYEVVWESDGCAMTVTNFEMPHNEWTHIAFAFTLEEGAAVYINGVAQVLENWVGPNDFHVCPSMIGAQDVNIGRDTFNHGTLTNTRIDDFQFFGTALSEEEVLAIYNSQTTSIQKNDATLPNNFNIAQNHPNPFNPSTQITYSLGKNTNVELNVYDILGHNVATLVNEYQQVGTYNIVWDASEFSAGEYFYTMKADNFAVTKKMLLVK